MKYLLGVFATVFILIAAIFWIRSDSSIKKDSPAVSQGSVSTLESYADTNAKVSYEISGELVGEEARQSIRITVDRNFRTLEVLDGYNKTTTMSQQFKNNPAAFEEFIFGLAKAGFMTSQETNVTDEKGVCPKGNRTIYLLTQAGKTESRLWSGSCGKKVGNFGGDIRLVEDLFQAQIPEYRDLTRDVEL